MPDIQKGAVIHHHDHDIMLSNFSATNNTPNSPTTPIPELELEFELFIFYLVYYVITSS